MKISKQEVLHVAALARLHMDEARIDTFAEQIGSILEYVETLDKVDTTGVVPTFHAVDMSNAFREDQQKDHLENSVALVNAPEEEDGAFVVPKIL